jgi:single-stranded-DNA-specific exonuclease
MRERLWEYRRHDDAVVGALARDLGIHPVLARLLAIRGLVDPDAAARFLSPRIEHLHDPWALTDMSRAVDRLVDAIGRKERIAIHGDYDVDGVTSTVMLRRILERLGGDVIHFIPERLRDGYGLQPEAVERLQREGAWVVVSVDCGIRSLAAACRARDLGIDLIVTDHHEPDAQIPEALAVINPKRRDCSYPDKNLAGSGVAFKLTQALCARAGHERWLPSFLKIAALGTVADVVPLVGENRIIAKIGLEQLSAGPHAVGLQALLDGAGLGGRAVDSYHVAFVLAPRVNAAGRMSTPDLATRLLLASAEHEWPLARELAEQLNVENAKRQAEEAAIVAEARTQIEADPHVGAHNILVVAGQGWHRGVIGIVASKLVETFVKPAIVISVEGDTAHGSCRSIPPFDMLSALDRCADLFDRFGGHRQAAGFSLPASRIDEMRGRLTAHADEVLAPDDLRPRLEIDVPLALSEITPDVVDGIARLAPFGMGNGRPLFSAHGIAIVAGPTRLKDRHLTMTVGQGDRMFRAVAWRAVERLPDFEAHRLAADLAFSLERNTFRGETTVELTIADIRHAS